MNDSVPRRRSLSKRAVVAFALLGVTGLSVVGCETAQVAAPIRAELTAEHEAPGLSALNLWVGDPNYGAFTYGINEAGVVVGREGPQVVVWDRGTLTPVGPPCGSIPCIIDRGAPIGINSKGQIAGTLFNRAFLWHNGAFTDLGPGFARWINDAGDVLGMVSVGCNDAIPNYHMSSEMCPFRTLLWRDGNRIDLGTLGGLYTSPAGLNNAGEVAGTTELSRNDPFNAGDVRAFIWKDGKMTDLGTLGGPSSAALGINSRGQVVGLAEAEDGVRHAVLWDHGMTTDLGEGSACGINAAGRIVGVSGGRAVVWDRGTKIDIGVAVDDCVFPFSGYGDPQPPAINAKGQVALTSASCTFDHCSAYLWDNGVLIRLNDLGGNYAVVSDINTKGWITGHIRTASGEYRAVLWIP